MGQIGTCVDQARLAFSILYNPKLNLPRILTTKYIPRTRGGPEKYFSPAIAQEMIRWYANESASAATSAAMELACR
jgi:hypothetical protein